MKYTIVYHKKTNIYMDVIFTETKTKKITTDDIKSYVAKSKLDIQVVFEGWPLQMKFD